MVQPVVPPTAEEIAAGVSSVLRPWGAELAPEAKAVTDTGTAGKAPPLGTSELPRRHPTSPTCAGRERYSGPCTAAASVVDA